jgi:peptidyl-prolyl cis-trans isomerase SurA
MTRFLSVFLALAFVAPAAAQNAAPSSPAPNTAPPASSPNETVVEEIVARVNSSIITRADLRREEEKMVQEIRQQNVPDANAVMADRQKNLLRTLIDQQLLVQKGADLGITADTEVIKRLDEMRKEMGANSMEDLEKMAESQGISFEDYKQNMKNSIITQQVIGREVGGRIQITHDDIQKFYNEHKAEFDQPERIRLSEILVGPAPKVQSAKDKNTQPISTDPTPDELAQFETKANEALAKIKGGAKFEDVAKQYSSGPTVDQGGDLGYFKRGTMSKELEDQTFKMKAGDITGVTRTKQGFVILKVTDHIDAGVPPLKLVEDQIRETLYYQQIEPKLRDYLTRLREDAYIDVKQGFVDTGASANQTKLVYTNAESDKKAKAQKQKKKKKHFLLF